MWQKTRQIRSLEEKVKKGIFLKGVNVDEKLHADLLSIMKNMSMDQPIFPEGSLRRLFWMEQIKAASLKDMRNVRWHPLIIRWCLSLKLSSSSAYRAMRDSGFIKLPSERTLRDYYNVFKSKPGIQAEVNEQLAREASLDELESWQTHVCVIFDEVKIKEGLVYDKYSGDIIGYTDLGSINEHLDNLEVTLEDESIPVATSMFVFMVRGLFIHLNFPYAQFPCCSLNAAVMFPIVWDVIRNLELIGFKVLALTADGLSCNRTFFKMHSTSRGMINKVDNPYASEARCIYFFSDPPHLLRQLETVLLIHLPTKTQDN